MVRKLTALSLPSGNADASGDATGTTTKTFTGRILAINLVYDATSAAGTDVVISTVADGNTAQTVLTVNNANTSAWFYPRTVPVTAANANFTYDGTRTVPAEFVVHGRLRIVIDDQTEGKGVTAIIVLEEF